jgi:hypothetical protein
MTSSRIEDMPYRGESPQDRTAFAQYMKDIERGKSLLGLLAMRDALTPEIRKSWYAGTFTPINTTQGTFDELTCNLAYHFSEANIKTSGKYTSIAQLTMEAKRYFQQNRAQAKLKNGVLKFPNGSIFMPDGRIVTYW